MKKKKTIIFRIICLLMLCIFPALALLSGCDEFAELVYSSTRHSAIKSFIRYFACFLGVKSV